MTAIDRTAYPRPGSPLTVEELEARYHLNDADLFFVHGKASSDAGRLTLAFLLKEALATYGPPEIFNSDQGSQFTSTEFTDVLKAAKVKISMDGRGRWIDNL